MILFNLRCGYAAFKGESVSHVDGSLRTVHREGGRGGYCAGLLSGKHRRGARPLFSPLLSFDDRFEVNFEALLGEAPALAVVLCDEQVQMDVSAGF